MPQEVIRSVNLDANESIFFARELEAIKARSYDQKYPTLQARTLFPVSYDAGTGAESITYRQFDSVGVMKIIANYADDLPRSDVKGKEFTSPVRGLGGSYGYNVQEIRNAMKAGRPLEQRKANAVRMSNEQMLNRIAWYADGTATWGGLYGILYNANTSKSAAVTGTWSGATADQIIGDVNALINNVLSNTKGVESVDTVVLPVTQYTLIASTPRSTTSDTTILEFLRRVHPGVTFGYANELASITNPRTGSGTVNVMIAYRKDPDHLTMEIPQEYEQFPAQERNLEFVVPCHSRCGGVIIYYPLSVHIVDGI